MTLQGLNITVTIQRNIEGVDDAIGGATEVAVTIGTGIRARISSIKPSEDLRIQGIETSRMHNGMIYPATTDIREGDYVIPENGSHEGDTFRVTGVQIDSLNVNSRRAHLSIRLQRDIIARTIQ